VSNFQHIIFGTFCFDAWNRF